MNEYLLKPTDLVDLRKFQRRSPYVDAPAITVYLRRDVEMRALQVWKTFENLQRELKKRKQLEESYRDSVLNVKKILKEYKRLNDPEAKMREEVLRSSGRVVMSAILINSTNFLFKALAWLYTGSHSLFAEAIHSLADTCNQLILYFGLRKSIQVPNDEHPYGYHNARYIASLISGVGIFCVGSGLSFYHGIHGLLHPESIESLYWAYLILGGSFLSEGGTLMIAFNAIRKGAKAAGVSFKEYVFRSSDPSVNVVLLEDAAAVLGVAIAAGFMGLTSYYDNPIYDSIGSLLVGGLLGGIASFIIYSNSGALVGRSIPPRKIEAINKCLENDVMIRAIYDVKATDLGNNFVRYKAEVDIDGIQLTRHYLDTLDLEVLLEEMKNVKTIEDVEAFLLKHGENIVDLLGAEVDRIENQLKKQHPQLRHVDLEVL
ncbi:zinc transporter 9-like protein [Dinothrombium tinctorium]|uniref:Proton-coupled zinc antiporter SLC30A9, mitochondrial n=2 Tax=Dinothrombium tinctorium TaxID=1965070 RepID=A0A3S3NTX6_9ACAR|nr:zinc transporter 9-like protein [Dinothrombium tinctorium]